MAGEINCLERDLEASLMVGHYRERSTHGAGREMRTSPFEFTRSTHFAGRARRLASAHKFLPRSVVGP